ncbi:hypothetical protein ACFO5R_14415 [Halosolutus amylolyticus]|uniref:DUF7344 domain-containing protein n=1 Tax=Halosolutus amylolyticus TaxID=2932267 RepID=A0ABD5PR98_9EURY|nr:hypothetical protein [Halosolutus amylolyticus]
MTTTDRPFRDSDAQPTESGTEASLLSPDDVFHILQTFRRRETIRYLLDADGPVKMGDLADHVAAREHETTVAELTSTQRQRVYVPLYQSHLPKLDRAGVIEYDKPRGIVRSSDRIETFRPYLEAAAPSPASATGGGVGADDGHDRRYFVAAIAAAASLLVATAAGLELPGPIVGAIVTALVALGTASI